MVDFGDFTSLRPEHVGPRGPDGPRGQDGYVPPDLLLSVGRERYLEHDPYCPVANLPVLYKGAPVPCACEPIRRARADTGEKIAQAIEAMDPDMNLGRDGLIWGAARLARRGGRDA